MSRLTGARRERSRIRFVVPFAAALLAATVLGVQPSTAVPTVAAPAAATGAPSGAPPAAPGQATFTLGGWILYETIDQQPGCSTVGYPKDMFRRQECGFGRVFLTPATGGKQVKIEFIDSDGTVVDTQNLTSSTSTPGQVTFDIIPDMDWDPGKITVRATVTSPGDSGTAEVSFLLNPLDATVIPSEPSYAPGEAITVSGVVAELDQTACCVNRQDVVPADVSATLHAPDGTQLAGPVTTTANSDGEYTVAFPAAATQNLTATRETDFELALGVRLALAYDDPTPFVGPDNQAKTSGKWIGSAEGEALLRVPPDTLLVENSFVSSVGWVKPGDSYPFRVFVRNFTETAASDVSVTIPAPPSATFTSATPLTGSGDSIVTGGGNLITWDVGSMPAATEAGPAVATLVVDARAATLTQDPEIAWKDLSSTATLTYLNGPSGLTSASHGPKVIPPDAQFDSARYGDKPFPMVPVDYTDRKHKPDHSGEKLARVVNSSQYAGSTFNLYQEMSYGQLYPFGEVPSAGIATRGFDYEPGFEFSPPAPTTCRGATVGPAEPLYGTPAYPERIKDGWYQLPGDTEYYGGDFPAFTLGAAGSRDNACGPRPKAVYDAAQIADPEIDYNRFDSDKNGVVDFFMMVFVGCGGNGPSQLLGCPFDTAPYDNIWPHSSSLESTYVDDTTGLRGYVSDDQLTDLEGNKQCWLGTTYQTYADCGTANASTRPVYVRVGPYNVNPESAIDHASVISHEYGHHLGLPDFYNTQFEAYQDWNLMASDFSQHMTIFGKQEMGWVVPQFLQPGQTANVTNWNEIKEDTRSITWKRPDGTFYTLQSNDPAAPGYAQNIHNGQAYGLKLPGRNLIDPELVKTGATPPYLWHSGRGNDFGCPPGGGRNLDIVLPELATVADGETVTLTYKSSWDIEWDFDYGFTMVTTDGSDYTALPSEKLYTTPAEVDPNEIACHREHGPGITGTSGAYADGPVLAQEARANNDYSHGQPFLEDEYDLSEYAGQRDVVLRFSYFTDEGFDRPGWFIDDLKVTAGEGATARVIYQTNFTQEDPTRTYPGGCGDEGEKVADVCTGGWSRIVSDERAKLDHAYYLELRDRSAFDFNGRGQADRGDISWRPGALIEYTDEVRGLGNNGGEQPPRQHYLDSKPTPGEDCGNGSDVPFRCGDAAFTAEAGDTHFDDDPNGGADPGDWIDNFDDTSTSDDRWHFAYNCLTLDVMSMSGADVGPENPPRDPNPSDLTANATIKAGPGCATYDYGIAPEVEPPPPPVAPAVSIANAADVTEGNTGTRNATFAVTIPQTHSQPIRVTYRTVNGTARAPGDYTARSGSVTIPAGMRGTTITVPVRGDTTDEYGEYFRVDIAADSSVARNRAYARILDDDAPPTLRVNDITVRETDGTSYATFRVSLSAASGKNIGVRFATADGTARAGSDYNATSGTLSIPAGTTSRTVRVAIRGENLRETTEHFFLNLSAPSNATIADAQGRATIQDDDPDDPLVLLKKTGPEEARPGSVISYTLSYRNLGPFASANARMVDTLPANVTLYSATGRYSYDRTKRTLTWSLGTVPTDATGSRTVRVRVNSNLANGTLVLNRLDFYGDQTFAAPAFARTTVQR